MSNTLAKIYYQDNGDIAGPTDIAQDEIEDISRGCFGVLVVFFTKVIFVISLSTGLLYLFKEINL